MEITSAAAVGSITVICYLAAELAKALGLQPKLLPGLCGIAGGLLGVAGLYLMKDFPAPDLISAAAVGIASGLAATGADQAAKQLRSGSHGG